MIRRAFTMKLKPGALAEYRRHHDNLWPELFAEIERSGIATITTFERDPDLFLYSEIRDQEAWDRLWHSEIHDRWGELMDPLMEFRPDGIVDSTEVSEVFHLETGASADGTVTAGAGGDETSSDAASKGALTPHGTPGS